MLLANYAQQNRNAIREVGIAFTNPYAQFKPTLFPRFYCGDHVVTNETNKSSWYHGYNTQSAWHMAPKAGGMASVNNLTGSGSLTADVLAVKLAQAALTGSGDISSALGSLIVQALADLSGTGGISDANVQAFLQAVVSMTGSGGVTSAGATGLGQLIASIGGSGDVQATLTGIAELVAELTVTGSGLSTANVGPAVWAALASANNTAGTMGEKLNDAGSGSNPWTEVIESGYTAAEVLRILAAVLAGKVSGGGTGVETFKGLDGTTDRVVSTNDSSGNRTSVAVDGS